VVDIRGLLIPVMVVATTTLFAQQRHSHDVFVEARRRR